MAQNEWQTHGGCKTCHPCGTAPNRRLARRVSTAWRATVSLIACTPSCNFPEYFVPELYAWSLNVSIETLSFTLRQDDHSHRPIAQRAEINVLVHVNDWRMPHNGRVWLGLLTPN